MNTNEIKRNEQGDERGDKLTETIQYIEEHNIYLQHGPDFVDAMAQVLEAARSHIQLSAKVKELETANKQANGIIGSYADEAKELYDSLKHLKSSVKDIVVKVEELVGDAKMEIETANIDWALINSNSPDYDKDYKPEFPKEHGLLNDVFQQLETLKRLIG